MRLRRLPEQTINRIAAGEVVERPASAVKELVENAIDAGARQIELTVADGGRGLIAVADDGCGMAREELQLAIERHATSKLPDDDLLRIRWLGFRGEALPSIAAVGRLSITSRAAGAAEAWRLRVEGGRSGEPEPVAHPAGTRVEVRDLFFATPARLKFLRSARTEQQFALDMVRRLAMAHPEIGFAVAGERRALLRLPAEPALGDGARLERLCQVLGRDFAENAIPIDAERDGLRLSGYAGLPTYHRATSAAQFLFVNGRPVRDKLLAGAVRGAYADVLAHDRHAVVALFLEVPAELVDVNVHPAKAEVRFRDPGMVRGLIVSAIRHGLAQAGHRSSSTVSRAALGAFRQGRAPSPAWHGRYLQAQAPLLGVAEDEPAPAQAGGAQAGLPLGADDCRGQLAAPAPAPMPMPRPRTARDIPSARRAGRSTAPTSSRRPQTASCWSISTPPTSGWLWSA